MSASKTKSNLLSSKPNISWVTWLYKNGHLVNSLLEITKCLRDTEKLPQNIEDCFDSYEDEYVKIKILEHDVNAIELAYTIKGIVAREFDYHQDWDKSDSYYIAELLKEYSNYLDIIFSNNLSEIFIGNWKFSRHMRSTDACMYALLGYLVNPKIFPYDYSYSELISNILGIMLANDNHEISLNKLQQRLYDHGIEIEINFLHSIIINDEHFLTIHNSEESVDIILTQSLLGWSLAADLLDKSEYLKVYGLGFDDSPFHKVNIKSFALPIKLLLKRHGASFDSKCIDDLEISLKMRSRQKEPQKKIQGIPENIHKFIVSWIKDNNKIWMTQLSGKILGRMYRFKAENVAPGRLLVYGSEHFINYPDRLALVLREMVSESHQKRKMIHPSKILTPFHRIDISLTEETINSALQSSELFIKYGMELIDLYAIKILRAHSFEVKPYNIKYTINKVLKHKSDSLIHVGKWVLADLLRYPELASETNVSAQKQIIIKDLIPAGIAVEDFIEHADEIDSLLLKRLVK